MNNSMGFIDTVIIRLAMFLAMMLAAMISKPASANGAYQLDVTYTNGRIKSGPLSLGLSELPASVIATYTLGSGTQSTEPGEENDIYFDDEDVALASVSFGDATWTSSELDNFSMVYSISTGGAGGGDSLTGLTYNYLPINSASGVGIIILNFPLSITGKDSASGMPFEYEYTESTETLTPIVQALNVAIDIKPGSDPNCFNINGHGVIPVAVLGNADFGVSQIDLASVAFGELAVRVRGNKGPLCSIEYSNDDAYLDLVCHFEDEAGNWDAGNGEAMLTGDLMDGTSFEGTDSICVVP